MRAAVSGSCARAVAEEGGWWCAECERAGPSGGELRQTAFAGVGIIGEVSDKEWIEGVRNGVDTGARGIRVRVPGRMVMPNPSSGKLGFLCVSELKTTE